MNPSGELNGQMQQTSPFNFDLLNVINSNKQQEQFQAQPFGGLTPNTANNPLGLVNSFGVTTQAASIATTAVPSSHTSVINANEITSNTTTTSSTTTKQPWNLPEEFTGTLRDEIIFLSIHFSLTFYLSALIAF
jgi:hypothetical protein